eukprot:m.419762 g.419762  ORF g.419762 m.419762 type:complete len:223 (+) comp31795_c0_seq1:346-1014(+)
MSRGSSPAKEYIESHGSPLSESAESRVDELIASRKAEREASPDKPSHSNAMIDGLGVRGTGLAQVEQMLNAQNEGAARLASHLDELDDDGHDGSGAAIDSSPTKMTKKEAKKEKKRRSKEKKKSRTSGGSDSADDGAPLLSPSPDAKPPKGRGFLPRLKSSRSPNYLDVNPEIAAASPSSPMRLPPTPASPQQTERSQLILSKQEQKDLGMRSSKNTCCTIL